MNCGIWNKITNLLVKDVGFGNWGFVVEEVDTETPDSIRAITITDIMKMYNIDYIDILKIDIEGSEKELFESAYEEWLPKVHLIIIELHDRFRKGTAKSFFKTMSDYNFSLTLKDENIYCFMK